MSHWDILGIAKTNDERAIRKAYAVILKTIDQELEPEKFIALREALEQAKNDAYYNSLEEAENNDDVFDNDTQPNLTQLVSVISETDNLQGTQDNIAHKIEDEIPLHQRGFEFLFNAIQQQDHNVDIRKELVDYIDYILNLSTDILPDEHAQFYLEQLNTACTEAGLNGLNDFLNLNKKASSAINDTEQPLNSPNNDTPQPSLKQQEQHYKEDLEQLCRTLWDENLDDHTFNQFSHMLVNWQQQTLEHQMQTYDQLSYVLGNIRDETEAPHRFFKQWYDYFGNDVPPASGDAALHRLYDRIERLLVEHQFWDNIPAKYYTSLQALKQGLPFKPFKMLGLLQADSSLILRDLRQRDWLLPDMQATEQNPNLHYLRICSQWQKFWLPILLVCCSSISVCVSSSSSWAPYLMIASILLSLAWLPLIQAPLQALLYGKKNHPQILYKLTVGWYFFLPIIIALSPILNSNIFLLLLWLYSLLSALILGFGFYRQPNLFDEFQLILRHKFDRVILYVGFAGTVVAFAAMMNFFALGSIAESLSPILAIPLVMSLVARTYTYNVLAQLLSSKYGSKFCWFIMGVFILEYFNTFRFEWTTWPADLRDYPSFWLAGFILAFIGIPLLLSSRQIAYLIKYATYVLGIFIALRVIFISMILAYFFYETVKADREARAIADQQD